MSAQLLAQLKATRASIDAAIAVLESVGWQDAAPAPATPAPSVGPDAPQAVDSAEAIAQRQRHLAQRRQDASGNCPKCGAARTTRQSNQGFGMTPEQANELCGMCGHVFENT